MRWVVFNQKGGVGKSTLVSNLAAVAADEGERSLVVDLDPQGCSSHYLLGPRPPSIVRQDHNPGLKVAGIVVNSFQPRARLPQQLVDELLAEGLPVLTPYISASVKVRESHQESTPLVHFAPSHKLTGELRQLSASLRKKTRGTGKRTEARAQAR